ncbi:outer membrane beta-barrel protein [Psychroserpens luteolus]|uniref:outer membrane beta-barrel protein n=1 Tax=Psychroserpens luteolus TaxID=2855840 RepID=UPI001E49190C|nr:outer membrane beta-barrel protein [Psychroserpens luteolus]MCD2260052.1 outer membrane beta-barrel protein [Psychroserpens luteolus]
MIKNYSILIVVLLLSNLCFCQQLSFEFGTTVSSFDYENSQGQPLNNLLSKSKSYFGMGYRQTINNSRTLFLSLGASYNSYAAIGSESSIDNYFEWDVSYLGVKAGLGIKMFELRDLSFFANVSMASEFLIRGNQTINNDVFNLVGEEEFNNNILFFRGGVEMQYPISRSTAIFVGYNYGKSVLISSGKNAEKLNLNAHQFGLGFIINLPKCYCSY